MLNIIWIAIIVASVVYALFSGNAQQVSNALFDGASECIEFTLKIGSFMIMWAGFMNIAEKSGLTKGVAKGLSGFISKVFKGVRKGSREETLIATNISANMLGLSNAATPVGIEAMNELSKKSDGKNATNDMCMFAVINSASIQLIPSTLIAMRTSREQTLQNALIVLSWIR